MKKIILSAALLLCGSAFAQQDTSYNKVSIDLGIGACNVLSPRFTPGLGASFIDPLSVRLGARKMVNKVVGYAWVLGYDNISSKANSPKFTTHNFSSTIQGYVNLGNLYQFSDISPKFGMMLHAGAGLSALMGHDLYNKSQRDLAISFVAGLMPQYRLSQNLSLNFDFAMNFNLAQARAFDLASYSQAPGFGKYFGYATVGVSYYGVGKNKDKNPADWTPNGYSTKKELEALRAKLAAAEAKLVDSDNDGVANYLDAEPNTPAGSMVNAKGQAIVDMDGDGIVDSEDFCPTVKGTAEFKGCPMAFAQETKTVVVNEVAGTELTGDIKTKVATVSKDVNFDTKSVQVKGAFRKELDALAKLMNENASLVVALHGHCDNVGEDILNNQLSEDRAKAVKDYLIAKGVSASRISTKGFGITQPKASNDTEKGRAINRRVELIVKMK
jgi:OOP family OmpA-OmpF porin